MEAKEILLKQMEFIGTVTRQRSLQANKIAALTKAMCLCADTLRKPEFPVFRDYMDRIKEGDDVTDFGSETETAKAHTNTGKTEETVKVCTLSTDGDCPPRSFPAEYPLVYNTTLKDGEEIQIMELAREGNVAQFILVDCLADEYRMNPTDTTKGGWDACELRGVLNGEILNRFPDELCAAMVPFENGDLLRLPTREEIFGDENGEGQFELMKLRRNRIALQGKNGPWEWYWLSSVAHSTNFCGVYSTGTVTGSGASYVRGVRPRFQLRVRSES